jgi:hypothetical protein
VMACYPTQHPGTDPGTLTGMLSRWRDGYDAVFTNMVQVLLRADVIAVQVRPKAENSHGARIFLRAAVHIRIQCFAESVWVTVNCKNCDEQFTIVRVMPSYF